MKRFIALALALTLVFSVAGFAEEVIAPKGNATGKIGTSTKVWGYGYFDRLPGYRYTVASKDWGNTSGTWTLSATEKQARLLYVKSANGAINIVAPSEEGRVYTVFNNSGQTCTIKKSAGTGISVSNGKVATVMYFSSNATTDYMRIASDTGI